MTPPTIAEGESMHFTIPLEIRTKKNHSRVVNVHGKPIVIPSKQYTDFEKEAIQYCPDWHIDYPVIIKAVFYMRTRRRIDLNNALQFTDMLIKAGTIEDDNCNIIVGFDGSRIDYDKDYPRIEVELTKYRDRLPFE